MNSVLRSTRSAGGAAAAGFVKPPGTNCLGTRQPYKSPLVFPPRPSGGEGSALCGCTDADGSRGELSSLSFCFQKHNFWGIKRSIILFCRPSPRVPVPITAGSISSGSKSMAVPRGGDSIFPFPIKMEEQLLAYEQRCPSRCFPSNTAFSRPPSLQQQPGSSCTQLFPAEPGGFSVELPQHRP